jgi:hypothetical protein
MKNTSIKGVAVGLVFLASLVAIVAPNAHAYACYIHAPCLNGQWIECWVDEEQCESGGECLSVPYSWASCNCGEINWYMHCPPQN